MEKLSLTKCRNLICGGYSYDEKKQLNKANHRQPVFKVFFLYSPAEQRVSVKVKGGKVKKEALIRIFVETVLGQKLSSRQKVRYDLNVLKNFHHSFSAPIADNVENVKVIELRLVYLNSNGRRMVLSVNKDGFGMEDMGRFIEESGVPLNQIIITQAKIHVKFKPEFKRAKGTVTAQIIAPDSCNLGVKKNDRKVRQYLKDWGIDKSEL